MKNPMPALFMAMGALLVFHRSSATPASSGQGTQTPNTDASQGTTTTPTAPLSNFWSNLFMSPTNDTSSNQSTTSVAGWLPPTATGQQRAQPYVSTLESIDALYSLPAGLLTRIAWQESRFRQDIIDGQTKSSVGAVGMFQLMPATAAQPGYGVTPIHDLTDWKAEATFAAQYLSALHRDTGDWKTAIAAYNWGLGNVQRHGLSSAPAETVAYVNGVAGDLGLA